MSSKTEKESTPEEILETIESLQQHLKPCKHCKYNVKSTKPYITMVEIPIPDSIDLKQFKEGTPEYRKALDIMTCRTCIAIQALRNLPKEKQLAFLKDHDPELINEGLSLN
jgi:hypothetical protein